jgi:hypothetical protein
MSISINIARGNMPNCMCYADYMLAAFHQEFDREGMIQFYVRARPGAAKTCIREVMADESVKIDISAPPEGGRANIKLVEFLSREFGVGVGQVEIISGKTAREKLVRIKS